MRRLAVSEFDTPDGVIEAPRDEEHRDGKNRPWLAATEDQQRFKIDELSASRLVERRNEPSFVTPATTRTRPRTP